MDSESTLRMDTGGNKWWMNEFAEYHRIGGSAMEWNNGHKEWRVNGVIHREDGPAIITKDGMKEWWLNDFYYETKEDYFNALSDEAKAKCLFSEDFLNG